MKARVLRRSLWSASVLTVISVAVTCIAGDYVHWPLRNIPHPSYEIIWATYGDAYVKDYDEVVYHKGIDLHQPGGTPVYPVKNGLKVAGFGPTDYGFTYVLADASQNYYVYGHLDTIQVYYGENNRHAPRVGEDIPDTSVAFCEIWRGEEKLGSVWDDHLEFQFSIDGLVPRNNPLWQDPAPGNECLRCEHSPGAKIYDGGYEWEYGVTYGRYKWASFSDSAGSPNQYYCPLWVESGTPIDVFVYANTKEQVDGTGPVGVCKIEMWYDLVPRGHLPANPPPSGWPHVMDFTGPLPAVNEAKYAFGVEGYENLGACPIIPRSRDSREDSRTWYVITNFGQSGTEIDPDLSIWTGPTAELDCWLWFRVYGYTDTNSPETFGPTMAVFKPGPATPLVHFSAASMDSGIRLLWGVGGAENAVGYRIGRSCAAGGPFTVLEASWRPWGGSGAQQDFSFLDTGVTPYTEYWYRVDLLRRDGTWRALDRTVCATWVSAASTRLDMRVSPNPVRDYADIQLTAIPWGAEDIRIRVFDCRGRLVWRKDVEGSNHTSIRWDAVASDGVAVAPGVYFFTADCGQLSSMVKVVRLK